MVELIAKAGGLFAYLAFVHFVVDFIFQTHAEAMIKHKDSAVRARHCLIYTAGMLLAAAPLFDHWWKAAVAAVVLFGSHFFEDTYVPVYLWAKHIRQPPGMSTKVGDHTNRRAFSQFVETPLGKILMIVVDQIIHLFFLWIVVAFALM